MLRRHAWLFGKPPSSPPATVVAISPSNGPMAGGTVVTIQVSSTSGMTSAAIDGIDIAGFGVVDGTHVSGTTAGDGSSGAKDVTVTNGGGTSAPLVGGFTYAAPFTPASLNPDGWWRGPFTGAPWLPTSPGDAHGNLVASGTGPLVGTAVNGITPASFDGTTSRILVSATAASNFVTSTAATVIALFKPTGTLFPNQVAWYSEAPVLITDGGDFGFSNSLSGVRGGDGVGHNTAPYLPLASGAWGMCAYRVSGTTVKCRVSQASGTSDSTPASMPSVVVDALLKLGVNFDGSAIQHGDVLEVIVWKRVLSDSELVQVMGYLNTTYALSLT